MRLFYSGDYVRAEHGFDTTRKSQWIAESLITDPINGVEIVAPQPADVKDLEKIHDPRYVNAVVSGQPRKLAESQSFPWDEGIFHAACASTGGVVAAVEAALTDGVAGSLSSGLHHANYSHGKGNCTFNGLALATLHAQECGARSVLIVDADAHFGGGTHSLVYNIPGVTHVDISTNVYDAYVPRNGNVIRLILRAKSYLPTLEHMLARAALLPRFDLCIYNAGMDPHELCSHGGLRGITAGVLRERECIVFEWCAKRSVPVAFVIAGGYVSRRLSKAGLVGLHRTTIEAAVGTA
ncbi:MAG: hypothetical protein KBD06_01450 [Candidatus Pacebacteria bacterium]|nr:hypothetical protein [Candidatus Paceibacterota bacterium]